MFHPDEKLKVGQLPTMSAAELYGCLPAAAWPAIINGTHPDVQKFLKGRDAGRIKVGSAKRMMVSADDY